ncbi:MAG: hypothetical protein ACTMKV_12945, partial [Sphingomonas parapaucimobilis]
GERLLIGPARTLLTLSGDDPMTFQPIITAARSDAQREEAERVGLPSFIRGFEIWLETAAAFQGQDDIDGAALTAGIAAIRARVEAGFDAAIYLELKGMRGPGSATIWEEVLLAAIAPHIGLADEVDPRDLEIARRLGLA